MPTVRESDVRRYLDRRIADLGGEIRAVSWLGRKHAPDVLALLPGRAVFIEAKRPTTKGEPGQLREHERMRNAGLTVVVLATFAEIDTYFPPPTKGLK